MHGRTRASGGYVVSMGINSYNPPKRVRVFFHSIFTFIYLLLIVRAVISLYQGPATLLTPTQDSLAVLAIKRTAGIVYSPFWLMLAYPTIGGELVTTILFALVGYALLHYGMFLSVPVERRGSTVNKLLDLCRMLFFLAGTLLVLLMVARMGVMLYQDLTWGRVRIAVPAGK